jgi:hypothetical protein
MGLFFAANGATPTTAAQVPVATGTAIKTLLQVASPATADIEIVEWGISFDGSAAATPIRCELIETGTVAATGGTSLTPTPWDDPLGPISLCVGGTGATCFSPTTEGTITATRVLDVQFVAPSNQYWKQFPLGNEPQMQVSRFLRVRVTATASVNAYCYIIWRE